MAADRTRERQERALALWCCMPALVVICAVALFPLGYTLVESLYLHDLRMPWLGRPFVGLANYGEALGDERFWSALAHSAAFTLVSVSLELVLGLVLALQLHATFRGRGLARTVALLPWAMPSVVVGLVWRFLFEPSGAVDSVLALTDLVSEPPLWLNHPVLSWVPVVLADVWKTTPFVALLLLAGLQTIDPSLYEAARVDGARSFAVLLHVTLPGLRPALLVALIFRSVDALRVFDLIFVLTSGGPGTATEPLAMYSFVALLRNLRFGYGSALAMIVFALTVLVAAAYLRVAGRSVLEDPSS